MVKCSCHSLQLPPGKKTSPHRQSALVQVSMSVRLSFCFQKVKNPKLAIQVKIKWNHLIVKCMVLVHLVLRWSRANENLFATTGCPGKICSQLLIHHLGHPQVSRFLLTVQFPVISLVATISAAPVSYHTLMSYPCSRWPSALPQWDPASAGTGRSHSVWSAATGGFAFGWLKCRPLHEGWLCFLFPVDVQ